LYFAISTEGISKIPQEWINWLQMLHLTHLAIDYSKDHNILFTFTMLILKLKTTWRKKSDVHYPLWSVQPFEVSSSLGEIIWGGIFS